MTSSTFQAWPGEFENNIQKYEERTPGSCLGEKMPMNRETTSNIFGWEVNVTCGNRQALRDSPVPTGSEIEW